MYLTTKGLVLRVTDYNDRDALLTLLTPNHGKLTVKARALRKKNSPLIAPCQLLAYGDYTLFEYRGAYTVNEVASIELFSGLRRDLPRLSLGTYFAQVSELLSQEDLPNPELLSLTLNCLYALSRLGEPENKVKAVFELRAMCLAGFLPDLSGCAACGNPYAEYFDISAGHLECGSCRNAGSAGLRMPLNWDILQAMRYLTTCEARRLFAFSLGAENLNKLSGITESYLTAQLERGFSTLDFYKSLLMGENQCLNYMKDPC